MREVSLALSPRRQELQGGCGVWPFCVALRFPSRNGLAFETRFLPQNEPFASLNSARSLNPVVRQQNFAFSRFATWRPARMLLFCFTQAAHMGTACRVLPAPARGTSTARQLSDFLFALHFAGLLMPEFCIVFFDA